MESNDTPYLALLAEDDTKDIQFMDSTITYILQIAGDRQILFLTEVALPPEEEDGVRQGIFNQLLQSTAFNNVNDYVPIPAPTSPNGSNNLYFWKIPVFGKTNGKDVAIFLLHADLTHSKDENASLQNIILGFALFVSNRILISENADISLIFEKRIQPYFTAIQLANMDMEVSIIEAQNRPVLSNLILVGQPATGLKTEPSMQTRNQVDFTEKFGNIDTIRLEQLVELFSGTKSDDIEEKLITKSEFIANFFPSPTNEDFRYLPILKISKAYFHNSLTSINSSLDQLVDFASNANSLMELLTQEYWSKLNSLMTRMLIASDEATEDAHKTLYDDILSKFVRNISIGSAKHLVSVRDELIFRIKTKFEEIMESGRESRLVASKIVQNTCDDFVEKIKDDELDSEFSLPTKFASSLNMYSKQCVATFKRRINLEINELALVLPEFETIMENLKKVQLANNQRNYEEAEDEMREIIASSIESYVQELEDIGSSIHLHRTEIDMRVSEINDDILARFSKLNKRGPDVFVNSKTKALENEMLKPFNNWLVNYNKANEELHEKLKQDKTKLTQVIAQEVATCARSCKAVDELYLKQERIVTEAETRFRQNMQEIMSQDKYMELSSSLLLDLKQSFVLAVQEQSTLRLEQTNKMQEIIERTVAEYTKMMDNINQDDVILDESLFGNSHQAAKNRALSFFANESKEIEHPGKSEFEAQALQSIELEFQTRDKQMFKATEAFENKTRENIKERLTSYQVRMMRDIGCCKDLQELSDLHNHVIEEMVSSLKTANRFLNPRITDLVHERLQDGLERAYSDITSGFSLILATREKETGLAISEAKKIYGQEIEKHQRNTKFNHPDDLKAFHLRTTRLILTRLKNFERLLAHQQDDIKRGINQLFRFHEQEFLMNLAKDPAIGIDLGTTYTCACVYQNGKMIIIPSAQGPNLIPSCVNFTLEGQADNVGIDAWDNCYVNSETTVFEAKRIIGRKFNDPKLQKSMTFWPFNVIESKNGIPKIQIGTKQIDPEEVAGVILQKIRETTSSHLGIDVKKAVITVPAYFNDGQRQATIDAGKIAGLDVLAILTEPVAASVAFQFNEFETRERHIFVYDLGGGTFDVAVLKIGKGKIDTLAKAGDTHLGGGDFDQNIMRYCVTKFQFETGVDLMEGKDSNSSLERQEVRRQLHRLLNACENKKKSLSESFCNSVDIIVPDIYNKGSKRFDLKVKVTRDKFNELNNQLFEQTITIVQECLISAQIKKDEINNIVMVGGSTRILKVRELLSNFFNGATLDHSVNPDEAVAFGAGIHAAILNGQITKQVST